jgi:hypothetical protein
MKVALGFFDRSSESLATQCGFSSRSGESERERGDRLTVASPRSDIGKVNRSLRSRSVRNKPMKRCPQCGEEFANQQAFCDLDGAALLSDEDLLRQSFANGLEVLPEEEAKHSSTSPWLVGIAGVFVGVVLCAFAYLLLAWPPNKSAEPVRDRQSSQPREVVVARPNHVAAAPLPTDTPLPEPSESPSPAPSEASQPQSPEASLPKVSSNLNDLSVSTGEKTQTESKRAVILMKDGSSVEADAAWQDSEGVWYRRSGLVSFVETNRVAKITEASQQKSAEPSKH